MQKENTHNHFNAAYKVVGYLVLKTVMVFFFILSSIQVQAQIKMPDMIVPGDTWGVIDVNKLYGGCMQVDTHADLLNIDVQYLKRGMLFVVYDDDATTPGLQTKIYMFLPAEGTWLYNTPFEIPAANQNKTIASANLESYLVPVNIGSGTNSETTATIKIKLGAAAAGVDGYLTGADWNIFNANLTGDVTSIGKVTTIANNAITDAKMAKSTIPISGFANPVADVLMGDGTTNHKISNLADPIADQDAVTKKYVDISKVTAVVGNLYQGIAADISAFNGLSWLNITSATNLGTSIPGTICNLDASNYTWIAFPKAWEPKNFFYRFGSLNEVSAVIDGFEKRIIPAATTGSVDYQVWVFKTTPNIAVNLIINN
jgi:hypothetical protein